MTLSVYVVVPLNIAVNDDEVKIDVVGDGVGVEIKRGVVVVVVDIMGVTRRRMVVMRMRRMVGVVGCRGRDEGCWSRIIVVGDVVGSHWSRCSIVMMLMLLFVIRCRCVGKPKLCGWQWADCVRFVLATMKMY